ncbi:MAG: PD40 domain-containing protein, partial [Proteobacteria bacterium]|nr:PD40 domain-containing protein [Pseudomonadota bacterium]
LPAYDLASSELWSVKPDGSGLLRLTTNDLHDGQPSVSKDGRKIVFVGDSRVLTFAAVLRQLFVLNADGTGEQELALNSNADEYDPAISPDGKHVAFISDRDGNPELYVGPLDGSTVMRMTATLSDEESSPAWSPDGHWIVVVRRNKGADGAELWEYTSPYSPILGPPGPVNITALVGANNPDFLKQYNAWANPDWSPDGYQIAFSAAYEGMLDWYVPSQVFTVDLRTFNIFKPEDPTDRYVDYSIEEDPNWSPDGSQIVFTARDPSAPKLVVIRASGFRVGEISIAQNRRCWQANWARAAFR